VLHTCSIGTSTSPQSSKKPLPTQAVRLICAMDHMTSHSNGQEHVNKDPPSWTLRCHPEDVGHATQLACHLVDGLKVTPLEIVLSLLKDCVLKTDDDDLFVFLQSNRRISWEREMINAEEISAPLLLWHLLIRPPYRTHMAFSFSVSKEAANIFEASIPYVCNWYRHVIYNPPLVDLALRFGRGCVQEVIAYGANQLRRVYRSYDEFRFEMMTVISSPWNLKVSTVFTESLISTVIAAPIPVKVIELKDDKRVDIMIEGSVGLVMADQHSHDKTVVSWIRRA